jgi:single-strand DNA-binding protein
MSMSLNRAQLIGNLTKDPEVRQTPNGNMVASFTVATNHTWKDQNGGRQEKAEFHNIVAWGKLAEICQSYLQKGKKIFIEGRIQTRDWEGDDGIKRYKTEIIADNMIMLSNKSEDGNYSGGYDNSQSDNFSSQNQDFAPVNDQGPQNEDEISIDDLPF